MPVAFECPAAHRAALEAVKQAVGINHHYLDSWIYLFLCNKGQDVTEAVAKLQRRDAMERTVFAHYEMTPSLRESMRSGIAQYIGRDKAGRPILYFTTVRDTPTVEQRPERQANLDMILSWAARCDPMNPTSTVTWLVNQQDASMIKNTDLIFQKDMALRISKFFPGVVGRMYICNMGTALTFVMKPLLKQLPKGISECLHVFSGNDIQRGKLRELIDESVIPVALGGSNDCDHPHNYELFASSIESHFDRCMTALSQGISIKDMEVAEVYRVSPSGEAPPAQTAVVPSHSSGYPLVGEPQPKLLASCTTRRAQRIEEAGAETLDRAEVMSRLKQSGLTIHVDCCPHTIVVMSRALHTLSPLNGEDHRHVSTPVSLFEQKNAEMVLFECSPKGANGTSGSAAISMKDATLRRSTLLELHPENVHTYSFQRNTRQMHLAQQDLWELERNWTHFLSHSVDMLPHLSGVMEDVRHDRLSPTQLASLQLHTTLLRKIAHHALNLFPQTHRQLHSPVLRWFLEGRCGKSRNSAHWRVVEKVDIDCTSPDNFLLSLQGTAVQAVYDCDTLLAWDRIQDRVLRRLMLAWPPGTTRDSANTYLTVRINDLWQQLVPQFQQYIEAEVILSIAEFIEHYRLLVSGGKIDTTQEWYLTLFTGLVEYRELHRKQWLFHVFPPLFQAAEMHDAPPTIQEMLSSCQQEGTLEAACALVALVDRSVHKMKEHFSQDYTVGKLMSHLDVERYMEKTGRKVCIPYDSQREGFTPAQLVQSERAAMCQLLDAMKQPLREFLLLSCVVFAGNTAISTPHPNRAEVINEVRAARLMLANTMNTHLLVRKLVTAMCRIGYDMQGSFGTDYLGVLPVSTEEPTDGYAMAHALLFLTAYVSSVAPSAHAPIYSPIEVETPLSFSNDSFPVSTGSVGSSSSLSKGSMHSALSESAPTPRDSVPAFLECLLAIDISAAPIAGIKRLLVP